MDEQAKKSTLRMFTYGLYAVAAKDGDDLAAMTVNFVTQSSFTPPMITVAMETDSRTRRLVETGGHFALSVFRSGQRELAGQLGRRSANRPDKFDDVAWAPSPVTGDPSWTIPLPGWSVKLEVKRPPVTIPYTLRRSSEPVCTTTELR